MNKILIADDHPLFLAGLKGALLNRLQDTYIECADSYLALFSKLQEDDGELDLVIMDLNMPGQSALAVLERLHRRHEALRSLVFTMYTNSAIARQAFAAGACGYVTKSSDPEALLRAVRTIARGGRYVSPDVAERVAMATLDGDRTVLEGLTKSETEVLRLLLTGRGAEDVARTMNLSVKTVRNLHYAVKRKLGVENDIELVRFCAELGMVF